MAEAGETITVIDPKTKTRYVRGRFLGKGGFARCYEFTNTTTNEVLAGKVVSKSGLVKPQHKAKMSQEISIHKSTKHPYIVKFFTFFEDNSNIYIILELCRKRSLMEMHKRRKALTVPEVRYFMKQIVLACKYLHENRIIHRDLKLGNLFINDDMEIKVGDFGLATVLSYDGERKKTLCGTPNYIAPEILSKGGHSYEVDLWSLGCIMYTLLVGVPPFETSSLKATYNKIKNNEYTLPTNVDDDARDLIKKLLHAKAEMRPNPSQILNHSFFNKYIPTKLPTTCLTMAPRLEASRRASPRKPLVESNMQLLTIKENEMIKPAMEPKKSEPVPVSTPKENYHVAELIRQLASVVKAKPDKRFNGQDEDAQDPSLVPFVWISKWIDYSDKYGLGYCLCDNNKGVSFSDDTYLTLYANEYNLEYIDKDGVKTYFTVDNVPKEMGKKKKLLEFFIGYMTENLCVTGESIRHQEADQMAQVAHMNKWVRTSSAMLFHLTNGTLQINFFDDHTKIIICPIMGAASYIDEKKNFTVYNLKSIEQFGCSRAVADRLRYALQMCMKYLKT